jgi:tyrosinase
MEMLGGVCIMGNDDRHLLHAALEAGADPHAPHDVLGLSRRSFLRMTAVAAMGGLGSVGLGGCTSQQLQDLLDRIRNRPVRRNVATLAANHPTIQTYEAAITAMQQLPQADPRSWNTFAQLHATSCRHRTWLFLPWHRAYLFSLEQICKALSGDDSFALPYWNWTENPQIPAMFWNTSSPLFHTPRGATQSSTANAGSIGASVVNNIQNQTNFLLYAGGEVELNHSVPFPVPGSSGSLEATPHNYIHNFVGGTMAGGTSPRDPIFWLHHCRVDELWVDWNINRENPNTDDERWTQTSFDEFVDGAGNAMSISVIATVLQPLLAYRYDTQQV